MKGQSPRRAAGGLGGRGNAEEEGVDLMGCMGNASYGARKQGLTAHDSCANRDDDDAML